jgi:GWxTD domain-containing protein
MIVRPLQPRWIPPDAPQPVSLEWIDGDEWALDVQSIITSEELLAYGQLRNSGERDAFMAQFWRRRDPTPDTLDNEFRDEFTRRVQFAREHFAMPEDPGVLGVDTDRGRVYLMFGAPDSIETQGTGSNANDVWRYDSVEGLGDFRVRFSSARGHYCGYRIVSPSPVARMESVGTSGPIGAPAKHASVEFYAFGLAAISVPFDATKVAGARFELRNRSGTQVDEGQIGFLDRVSDDPLSKHLSRAWLDAGLGCTHALPADTYTLTTAVRFMTGQLQSETVTFDVR